MSKKSAKKAARKAARKGSRRDRKEYTKDKMELRADERLFKAFAKSDIIQYRPAMRKYVSKLSKRKRDKIHAKIVGREKGLPKELRSAIQSFL